MEGVQAVSVRRERDGSYRYQIRLDEQSVVSRESYPTKDAAIIAGELAQSRTRRWAQPEVSHRA